MNPLRFRGPCARCRNVTVRAPFIARGALTTLRNTSNLAQLVKNHLRIEACVSAWISAAPKSRRHCLIHKGKSAFVSASPILGIIRPRCARWPISPRESNRRPEVESKTVGVGMPGSLSPLTGLVRNSNSTWMNGKPFFEDLKTGAERPVRVENDANCFALSEAVDGAAAGARVVFGVILGTGCGGGVVVEAR